MSIAGQIFDAVEKMERQNPEGALFAICAAIEATATKEFGKAGRGSYKSFIHQNLGLITDIAFGGRKILNLNLAYDHPKINKTPEGLCPIEELFYHAVRCGLYHESALPSDVRFTDEMMFKADGGVLIMPSTLIYGLIVAVVVAPSNAGETSDKSSILNFGNFPLPISKLWGRRSEMLWLLEARLEMLRLQAQSPATKS